MLNSIAATLKAMHRYDVAREYVGEALRVHRTAGNGRLEAHAAALLGDMEMEQGRADRALPYFVQSLSLRPATDDHSGAGWMHSRIAAAHIALAQPERAAEHIAAARRSAAECADADLMNACGQLVSADSSC